MCIEKIKIKTLVIPILQSKIKGVGLYGRDGKRVGGLCVNMKLEPISEFVVGRQIFGYGTGFLLSPSGLFAALQDKDLMLRAISWTGNSASR